MTTTELEPRTPTTRRRAAPAQPRRPALPPAADRSTGRRATPLLAAALVAQPLLLGFNALFHPDVDLSGESLLAGARSGPDAWFAVHLVAAGGALLGIPAAFALRRIVGSRCRSLADTALVASVVGSTVLALCFAVEASLLRVAVTADIPAEAARELVETYTGTPEFLAVGVGLLAATASALLFAVAMLREGHIRRWIPLAIVAGTAVTTAAPPGTPVGPVAFVVVAAAGAALVPRVRDSARPTAGGVAGAAAT